MPTYEYACPDCNHQFERVQPITADPIKTCPECGKRKVHRLISATSFILKGGGWYSDGYADKKAASKEKTGGDAKTGAAAKSDSASSTKSDAAASSKSDSGTKSGGDAKPKAGSKAKGSPSAAA